MMQRNDFLSEAIEHRFYNNLSFPWDFPSFAL